MQLRINETGAECDDCALYQAHQKTPCHCWQSSYETAEPSTCVLTGQAGRAPEVAPAHQFYSDLAAEVSS